MKKRVLKLVSTCLVVLLAAVALAQPVYARTKAEVESEISAQKKVLEDLAGKIQNSLANKAEAQKLVKTYQAEYDKLVGLVDEKEEMMNATQATLDEKNAELSKAIQDWEKNQELYGQRLEAMYKMNNATAVSAMLDAKDLAGLMRALDALRRISQHDTELLEEMEQKKKTYEAQKADIEATIATVSEELARLRADRAWCQTKIRELNDAIAKADLAVAQNKKQQAETEAEIAQLRRELDSIAYQSYQTGSKEGDGGEAHTSGFVNPVGGGYTITGYFMQPGWPGTGYHYGVDFAAPLNTPIRAMGGGTVNTAGVHWSYGNYIIIDHGNGLRSLYAHCNSLAVAKGQKVATGQVIAYMGTTGSSSGVHLHLEVHKNGERQNPLNYF